jgi:flagellar hook assembly protein FlgD
MIRGGADSIGAGALSGAGRIDAFRSLRLAVNGTLADFSGDQKPIAFPNPFRTSQAGVVSFSIPISQQGANAYIKIYTMAGEYVQTVSGLTWDGRNAAGNLVATGTYIFVVSTANGSARGRVAVIR